MADTIKEVPAVWITAEPGIELVPGRYYGSGPNRRRIDKLEEHDKEDFLHWHVHFTWAGLGDVFEQKGFCTHIGFQKWLNDLVKGRNQEEEDRWNCRPKSQ